MANKHGQVTGWGRTVFVVKPRQRDSQKSQADESEAVNREAADQDSRGGVQFHWHPKCHHDLRLINK